jgi:CheY-like chemotaxis protein
MYNGMSSNILQQQQEQGQQLQLTQKYKNAARKRILIVNHEDDVSFALKLVLEEEGGQVLYNNKMNCFKVDSFNDSILALNNFEKGLYDLLIIAVVMPSMNGFELAKEIRRIDDKVKICFLIAGEIPSKVRFNASLSSSFGQEEGEGGYLDKFIRLPIENKDLIEQIDRITNS